MIDALISDRVQIDDDPELFYEQSLALGWGDGYPLIPPTERRVRMMMGGAPWHADDVVACLAPMDREATIELVAVNAVMAGCTPPMMPLVIAALEAMAEPGFNLAGVTTTTSSAFPYLIVNGPSRDRLEIDYGSGCLGGAGGRGSTAIGRAVALCLRNIGGQRVGVTSKSVFGQPARTGACFGEWEEESPWPSLAEQLGHDRSEDVVTVHASKGTHAIADVNNDDPRDLLQLIAKSAAFPLANKFLSPTAGNGQVVILVNPEWAQRFGRAFPDVADAQAYLHEHAWQPAELWPEANRSVLEQKGRVDSRGRVWLNERPDQFVLVVCGGVASLQGVILPSWADSELQHRAAVQPEWASL